MTHYLGTWLTRDPADLSAARRQSPDYFFTSRRFHPWEGGEGAVLRQFTQAHLRLGRAALESAHADGCKRLHRWRC